jgi:hypothetical protein
VTRRRAALAGVAVAGVSLAFTACGPGPVVRRGRMNEAALAALVRQLPLVRGLDFTTAVPARVLDPAGIRTVLVEAIDHSYPPADRPSAEAVYRRVGLLPEGVMLAPAYERLLAAEGGGFYDPRRRELVLASVAMGGRSWWLRAVGFLSGRDPVGEVLLAHELTHALQDQHYGIPKDPEPLIDSHSDRELARHALLEGDATLAGFAYVVGTLGPERLAELTARLGGMRAELATTHPDVPPLVRDALAFQYADGGAFAARALGAGGWPAIDRAHRDPPASTEQVLHPERYFGVRDAPVEIRVGGTTALARRYPHVLADTLGEIGIRMLVDTSGRGMPAAPIAAGWDGDRLLGFRRDGTVAIVWMTAWDTEEDADAFAAVAPSLIRESRVERRERRVLVVCTPPGTPDPSPQVWAATTFAGG